MLFIESAYVVEGGLRIGLQIPTSARQILSKYWGVLHTYPIPSYGIVGTQTDLLQKKGRLTTEKMNQPTEYLK